jgi:hypothetical protein
VAAQTSAAPNLAWSVNKLAVGERVVVTITAVVSGNNGLAGTTITNQATITTSSDSTPANNSDSAALTVFAPTACYATPNNGGTIFSSANAHAVQRAVDASRSRAVMSRWRARAWAWRAAPGHCSRSTSPRR